jgi:diacylglycerol kinase (ATP)
MTSQPSSDAPAQSVTRFDRAAVFVNERAGGGKAQRVLPLLEQTFSDYGISTQIRATPNPEEMEALIKKEIQDGVCLLFAMGGDGTLQGLVNAAYGHKVVLGVIPAGGGNDFARALNLPRDPLAALSAALCGEPRSVDLARVRTGDGHQRLFLGGGGLGLDADAAQLAGIRYRNWPGRSRYLAAAIHAYALYKPRRVRITVEPPGGVAAWQSCVLASVLNTPTFGAGIRLAPEARIDDGLLDLAFLEKLGFGRLLRILPRLALQGALNLPALRTRQFRKMRLETEAPAYFQGDGELLGPTPVEIEVVPGAVKFLAPKVEQS